MLPATEIVPYSCQSCCPPSEVPAPSGAADVITARQVLYIGTHARFVALDNGVALEILDSGNIWQRQNAWIEP